jgi:hypothetical protein
VGSRAGNVAVILFLVAQACDGVLTYVGVSVYGPRIEGNPLIAWMMDSMGQGLGLATTKAVAGAFGIVLHLSSVHRVLAVLTGFYVVVAVLPWIGLLFFIS